MLTSIDIKAQVKYIL